ncbi:KPN_02809 family neutral zinc metallopeptidase [Paracoccus aeridis]|uniref:KPN_02809 family neutral zinc metallopeptidase n=1 Tax=Paracoccus aeridis TaxID=1966466 RepID=UPI0010A9C9BD|nr:neutral zinc metallopeptidase [Paracoccus aeridis]
MEWRGRRGSSNIEDRRGMGVGGAGGLGVVGTLVVLAVGYFFGVDISPIVQQTQTMAPGEERELTQAEQEVGQFVSVVLADTEEVWAQVLPAQANVEYRLPTLVLFSGAVQSACGSASAAMGPFYCPGDERLYLDTTFFDVMGQQMGAGGDFAAAYVIAHEVGHHVQNQLGILPRVNQLRARVRGADANRLSVMTELQADCFAGIWARHASDRFGTIEPGDIDEAVNAARAVGDDMLQRSAGRTPMPDSFTHGSAAERSEWLRRGMDSGELVHCDTFAGTGL